MADGVGCSAQVDKAFEYLQQSAEVDAIDVRYAAHVRRTDGSYTGRGIYMREPLDTARPRTFQAQLQPRFQEVAPPLPQPAPSLCSSASHDTAHYTQRNPNHVLCCTQACT